MDRTVIDPAAVGTALRALVGEPPPSSAMTSVIDWLRNRLLTDELVDLAPGREPAPTRERERALSILKGLERTHTPELCHGDASPWNLLVDGTGRVILADPRGVTGEVAYDAAIVALKGASLVPTTVSVPYLAGLVGVNAGRVHAWMAS